LSEDDEEEDIDHGTGLHAAALFGRKKCLLALLAVGADVRALNANGKKPVEVASDSWIKAILVSERNAPALFGHCEFDYRQPGLLCTPRNFAQS
jgi:ankyrin repeat protein